MFSNENFLLSTLNICKKEGNLKAKIKATHRYIGRNSVVSE